MDLDDELFLQQEGGNLTKLILQGNIKMIETETNRLIAKFPKFRSVLYSILASHYMLNRRLPTHNDYEKAIIVYKKLIDLEDGKPAHRSKAMTNIGFAYRGIGDIDNALYYLNKSMTEFPEKFRDNPEYEIKFKKIIDDLVAKKRTSGK